MSDSLLPRLCSYISRCPDECHLFLETKLVLGTVLYFVEDRMVERIDLFLDDRRRLMSALDEAVPAGGHNVGMVLA